jgi:hypothetical protein
LEGCPRYWKQSETQKLPALKTSTVAGSRQCLCQGLPARVQEQDTGIGPRGAFFALCQKNGTDLRMARFELLQAAGVFLSLMAPFGPLYFGR